MWRYGPITNVNESAIYSCSTLNTLNSALYFSPVFSQLRLCWVPSRGSSPAVSVRWCCLRGRWWCAAGGHWYLGCAPAATAVSAVTGWSGLCACKNKHTYIEKKFADTVWVQEMQLSCVCYPSSFLSSLRFSYWTFPRRTCWSLPDLLYPSTSVFSNSELILFFPVLLLLSRPRLFLLSPSTFHVVLPKGM